MRIKNIPSMVTVIFFIPELYSFDELTEHVNSVPFNVLFTDCSVRVFVVETGTVAALLVHIMALESSRPGTLQVIL